MADEKVTTLENTAVIPVTQTDKGRTRQLIVTLAIAGLLLAGLIFFVWYSGEDGPHRWVYYAFAGAECLLAVNYVNDNVLLQLVLRMPLPAKLLGK